jgi:hypothetical protein
VETNRAAAAAAQVIVLDSAERVLAAGELSTGSSRTVLLEKGEAFLDFLSETPFDLNYPVTKLGKRDHRGANIYRL